MEEEEWEGEEWEGKEWRRRSGRERRVGGWKGEEKGRRRGGEGGGEGEGGKPRSFLTLKQTQTNAKNRYIDNIQTNKC